MPNMRGGKAYKKTKGGGDPDEIVYLTKEPDQMVGRIMRLLGDLNTSVFCQDNKTRICKISMGIKKKIRFFVGDVVLISLRDCLVAKADLERGKRSDRGDILGKYHQAQYSQLKAEGISAHLFAQTDTIDKMAERFDAGDEKGALAIGEAATGDDLFETDELEEGDDEDEEGGKKVEEAAKVTKPETGWKATRNTLVRKAPIDLDTL